MACVTGAGAGVDSVWEQKKLETRKMLENAAESPASSARFVIRHPIPCTTKRMSVFTCYWPGCQPLSGVSCICFERS